MLAGLAHELAGPDGAPWVTFVPGIGNDRYFWRAQAEALSSRYRVLLFDPFGHGDSPPPPEPCRFADVVSGVVALWDELGIHRSALVGLGFGGSVALATALDYRDRVSKVVACACRPRQPDGRRDFWRDRQAKAAEVGMARLGDMTVDRWLSEDFRARHPEIDTQLRAMFERTSIAGYQALVGAFIEMDFAARLDNIAVPTLLVAGEHDHGGGPVDNMQAMARQITGAQFATISGVGHIIPYEAPEIMTNLLTHFLEANCR